MPATTVKVVTKNMPSSSNERITVYCRCGEKFHVTPNQIGQRLKCPVCSRIFSIESPAGASKPPVNPSRTKARSKRPWPSLRLSGLEATVVVVCVIWVVAFWSYKAHSFAILRHQQETESADREQAHLKAVAEEQASFAKQMDEQDQAQIVLLGDPAYVSGALAQQRRDREWSARQAHDATLISTTLERNLVQMAQIGGDPAIAAERALEQVAGLAAPLGSRIEVRSMGSGYELRVAFLMSALSTNESGAITKHHSTETMRNEIAELSARVTKELFDYCGTRNIQKLSVTCNHAMLRRAIPEEATAAEREQLLNSAPVTLGRLYRVSLDQKHARAVANWRTIPTRDVIKLMTVEINDLRTLTITTGSGRFDSPLDPKGELEF